jgi:hypothetical protein
VPRASKSFGKSRENNTVARIVAIKPIKIASEIKEKQSNICECENKYFFSLPSIFIFPNEEREIHEKKIFVARPE